MTFENNTIRHVHVLQVKRYVCSAQSCANAGCTRAKFIPERNHFSQRRALISSRLPARNVRGIPIAARLITKSPRAADAKCVCRSDCTAQRNTRREVLSVFYSGHSKVGTRIACTVERKETMLMIVSLLAASIYQAHGIKQLLSSNYAAVGESEQQRQTTYPTKTLFPLA